MSSPSVPLTEIENNVAVNGSRSSNIDDEKPISNDSAAVTIKKSKKEICEEEADMEDVSYDHADAKKTNAEIEERKTSETELRDVYYALQEISTPGSTCTGGVASGLPALPGLIVKGVGTVPLPLTQDIASKLKSIGRQVPHGREMESVVHTTCRLQIEADQVTLQNKAWTTTLNDLVSKAATALGTDPTLVKPELYKLLMYEPGGFNKHKDTEKPDGTFATLAVQLPSNYTGGKFIISHNNKSQTFDMDGPDSAPYQCHYVAHYADCDYGILPIETGYRLVLIYSLRYTGKPEKIPRSQNIVDEEGVLSAMNRLDRRNSLFFIPLAQKYSTVSFIRSGDAAFEGSDRKLAKTLSQASGWKVLVGYLKRTDCEYGGYDEDFGYESDADADGYLDVEKEEPKFIYMYNQDGSDASRHIKWINDQMDLRSFDDDGMLLAMDNKFEQIRGGDLLVSNIEYNEKEGASRKAHCVTCLLVAFSIKGAFESVCRSDFCQAVNEVVENPSLLVDRILSYIRLNKQTITSNDFKDLHDVIREDVSFADSYWDRMKVLVDSLDSTEIPNARVVDLFASLAKVQGWNEKMTPINTYFTRLAERNTPSTFSDFFELIEVLLLMDAATEDDDIFWPIMKCAIDRFEIYSYLKADWNPSHIGDKLIALSNEYGSEKIGSIAKPCILRTLKKNIQNVTHLADILSMLRNIKEKGFAVDMVDTFSKDVLNAFLSLVEGESAEHSYSSHHHHTSIYRSVWCAPKVEILTQELISHGTPTEFQRIQAWASNANLRNLSAARSVFENIDTINVTSLHSGARDECTRTIHDRIKSLSIQECQKRENELLQATKKGEPVFSWSMPDARTGESAIDSFLKSPNEGPKTIVVGGGINNARQLESGNRYGHYGYSKTNKEHIVNGYSAQIQATKRTDLKASVTVIKTKQWYDARVEEYKNNMKELSEVQNKLIQLGAKPARQVPEPATKRPKTDLGNAHN